MKIDYVLVDFENVQPKNVGVLNGGPHRIKVFVGANQAKIPLEMARALQAFGPDAEYIQIEGTGANALDFHIAYYIGRLAAENPGADFNVISLRSTIKALFANQLMDEELEELIEQLTKHGALRIVDGKVHYELPA